MSDVSAENQAFMEKDPITTLKGVGPNTADKLSKIGIESVTDLLFHLPFRYQDRTHISPIRTLRPGHFGVIEGEVVSSQVKFGKRRSLLVRLKDGSTFIYLRFFHFNNQQKDSFKPHTRVRCFGEARFGPSSLEMVHPEYRILRPNQTVMVEEHLTPIYSTIDGLNQRTFQQLICQALDRFSNKQPIKELLPEDLLASLNFTSLNKAIGFIHKPPPDASVDLLLDGQHPCQHRLAFEELLAHHLSLRKLRLKVKKFKSPALPPNQVLTDKFISGLPFTLTKAQERVTSEISQDLSEQHPTLRLVQGDVGSGKTVIAMIATLHAVANDLQCALMAPTEILAEQHYQSFKRWLEPLGIKLAWLSGKLNSKEKKTNTGLINSGEATVAIGTHALFQKDIEFHKLGLVIIDEQHRFGVNQRLSLREKGKDGDIQPHQLIMTATPIPRTLAMMAYADLDQSVIDELPPGRKPIKTVTLPNTRREEIITRVSQHCLSGQQAYWVCTLIEESELLQAQAAEKSFAEIQSALPKIKIGLIHGRLKSNEKEAKMAAFKSGEIQLLIATTVIEVGVDVPNASLMIIENPERLGLAQLHQLRGRVGRGSEESFCVLMYQTPLSEIAKERLKVMRETNDGFQIADKDLELRGSGEVLGTKQTGLVQMKIANLYRDRKLLPKVREAANLIVRQYPELIDPIIKRWLGNREQYGNI